MSNEELTAIYDRHFTKIYRFFYYKVLSREIAQDLAGDTFVAFVDSLKNHHHEGHPQIKDPEKYLYGVAKIIFCEHLKEKYKAPNLVAYDNIPDFETAVTGELEEVDSKQTPEELLLMYLDRLPEKQRLIIRLRLIEKLSLPEIVKKLGKDMNYVKTTQKRALKNLREIFENNTCTPD